MFKLSYPVTKFFGGSPSGGLVVDWDLSDCVVIFGSEYGSGSVEVTQLSPAGLQRARSRNAVTLAAIVHGGRNRLNAYLQTQLDLHELDLKRSFKITLPHYRVVTSPPPDLHRRPVVVPGSSS